MQETTLHDFYELWPEKFLNVTNGVAPRRFVVASNPRLSSLMSQRIGDSWIKQLYDLRKLEAFVEDSGFRSQYQKIKLANKQDLAAYIQRQTGTKLNPETIFDVQVKRLHEYKRQHLNVLHIITLYNRIKRERDVEIVPRTFIFAGKAAPGYFMAKLIIKLINSVAEVLDTDPDVGDRLKVVFLPNYNVKHLNRGARWKNCEKLTAFILSALFKGFDSTMSRPMATPQDLRNDRDVLQRTVDLLNGYIPLLTCLNKFPRPATKPLVRAI